jgi:hypothetical protein
MDDMPGGAVAFELAAKFCYGITVKITARNVAALRCAAEYLEMTEEYEKDNLVTRTEAFLTSEVLASWKKSIAVLQSCVKLLPWAKELQIVKRCIESVAWKACTDPRGIRWSYSSSSCSCSSCSPCVLAASPASTTSSSSTQWSSAVSCKQIPQDWWFQDISSLSLESFGYVMDAIRVKGMRPELIGSAIVYYAHEWLPDLHRMSASPSSKHGSPTSSRLDSPPPLPLHTSRLAGSRGLGLELGGSKELKKLPPAERNNRDFKQNCRTILDALVSMLPCQADAISCSAALRLLRAASLLNASQETMKELERRAGMQLENANLTDLLIPSFLHTSDTLYDTDIVQRILEQFLVQVKFSSPSCSSFLALHVHLVVLCCCCCSFFFFFNLFSTKKNGIEHSSSRSFFYSTKCLMHWLCFLFFRVLVLCIHLCFALVFSCAAVVHSALAVNSFFFFRCTKTNCTSIYMDTSCTKEFFCQ